MLAQALDGDAEALTWTLEADVTWLEENRVLPAVARARRRRGLHVPEPWRLAEHRAAARWLRIEATRAEVAEVLSHAGVRFVPIKGGDVADRFYDAPEARPTSDLDLLIASGTLAHARQALEADGWRGLLNDPLSERYVADEGYAWPAVRSGRPLLEIHFRLWGLVPTELAAGIVERAVEDRHRRLLRPHPADAYLLAAVHHLLQPLPRPLIGLVDLERIAAAERVHHPDAFTDGVVARAKSFGLELPLALAARAAATLWPAPEHAAIVRDLRPSLRWPETRLMKRADAPDLRAIVLARLLARRPSRAGWRTVPRRVWSHPGVVAGETPAEWSWLRRRWTHVMRQLGLSSS